MSTQSIGIPIQERYLALDVLRGLTIALMVVVNTPGSWSHLYAPFAHADWHGFTITDLVFPTFLFVVGNAMSFSMKKMEKMEQGVFLKKVFKRSALIFLIFKDTILGFVASISVSVNDMVRIGDWITMDKFGADGDVIEINLATVKVRNFDNTTTTIPTYSLISDSFKNWRGMLDSDGRRIKRHVLIKANSVRFIQSDELEKFKKIQHLTSYIEHRQADIDKYNTNNGIDKSVIVNGRNLTNLGLFRKYINQYIHSHPGINKDMHLMVRHLQPTEKGIPLEIYCFSKDKTWLNYEHIMADIFDHIMASVTHFDLEIFESITNQKNNN